MLRHVQASTAQGDGTPRLKQMKLEPSSFTSPAPTTSTHTSPARSTASGPSPGAAAPAASWGTAQPPPLIDDHPHVDASGEPYYEISAQRRFSLNKFAGQFNCELCMVRVRGAHARARACVCGVRT
jgi:hypothetical protein